ncbi:putative tetratricopeptide-like helical domain superfamily [Helianthus anomalus]
MMTLKISTKIFRFFINPISLKPLNPNSSIFNTNHSFFTHPRCFSIISNQTQLVSQLIDVIKTTNGSNLNSINTKLSKPSICEIFRVLSCEKVLALHFFDWIRDNNPDLYRNSDVCSLMIDNCGWLNDYDTMKHLLTRFKHEQICLNDKAFGFLPVLDSSRAQALESVSLVVRVLGEIGGSVGSSGVYALISMLCATDCFELAKYVIEITEKRASYYAVLVREKCRRRRTEEAYGLIKKMRAVGCEPDAKMYNYILGCLCKMDKISEALSLVEEMKETGVDPDEITFEILISHACRLGRMDVVGESFDRLIDSGCVPRLLTYAAIVKGYFNAGRYEDAYAYVCDMEAKRMPQANKMFSLLARLHRTNGNVDGAAKILDEMMEKGLKPDYSNYARTVYSLRIFRSYDVAHNLQKKFSKFRV